jgi:hypothetical protein
VSLANLKIANPTRRIHTVFEDQFKGYGRVCSLVDSSGLLGWAKSTIDVPRSGTRYVPSLTVLEHREEIQRLGRCVYGRLPFQAGTCAGNNSQLTGVEYHQGSETVVAVSDCVMLLGRVQDIVHLSYDGSATEAFFIPSGTAVELFSTTLHYTPCQATPEGFLVLILLLEGTNAPLEAGHRTSDDHPLLTKVNKFLMVHASQREKIESGIRPGLRGDLQEILFSTDTGQSGPA